MISHANHELKLFYKANSFENTLEIDEQMVFGNNYVDVIGLDTYGDTLDIPNYASIVATGKQIG